MKMGGCGLSSGALYGPESMVHFYLENVKVACFLGSSAFLLQISDVVRKYRNDEMMNWRPSVLCHFFVSLIFGS